MDSNYKTLTSSRLSSGSGVHQPFVYSPQPITLESAALEVMTDLRTVNAATIDADVTVDDANEAMIARGVRSLLVVDKAGCVVGIITARDILGERPMQIVMRKGLQHKELRVSDVMTPQAEIEALQMEDVVRSKVGHIFETLRTSGRQHTLVVDNDRVSGRQMVRGIFSASQIARQLGIQLNSTEVARTFAEIEAVIGSAAYA